MDTKMRLIAQQINSKTAEVLTEIIINEKDVIFPKTIRALGYSHVEQIGVLQKLQEAILKLQTTAIDHSNDICPICNKKTRKSGCFKSIFNAIFTDHEISLQRKVCTCGWKNRPSILHLYGGAMHPDLVEMQCLLGADNSFPKSESILERKCCAKRAINNHDRIQKTVCGIGEKLSLLKQGTEWSKYKGDRNISQLIVNVDGGHVKSKEQNSPLFEEVMVTIYEQSNFEIKNEERMVIKRKLYVASAKNDRLASLKKMAINACLKKGTGKNTKISAISNGSKNCWLVVDALSNFCGEVEKILDWFYVSKKFKNVEHLVPKEYRDKFENAKRYLWHGKTETSIFKLEQLINLNKNTKLKINEIITYIKKNKSYIVNYQSKRFQSFVYDSHVTEPPIHTLINVRQKQKMQWSRKGADAILQIRTSKLSNMWESDWSAIQDKRYQKMA